MREAHGGVSLVDVLAACTRRAKRIDPQIRWIDHYLDRVVNFGENKDRRKRGMPSRVRVVRRDSHQPMDSRLGPQVSVREISFDGDGRALDSRAVAGLQVCNLGFEPAPLGPSQVKPQQHLGPVLRLLPTGARMYRKDRAEAIVL